jgi:hypothetical protein
MKVGWIDKLGMQSFNHDPHLPLFYKNISRKIFLKFKQIFVKNYTIMLRFFKISK